MSELQRVKDSPNKYWLGPVVNIYEIAEYAFVEYEGQGEHKEGKSYFSIFINGEAIGRSENSLDAAMVQAVAWKRDGANSQAAHFFMKMTGHSEPTSRVYKMYMER